MAFNRYRQTSNDISWYVIGLIAAIAVSLCMVAGSFVLATYGDDKHSPLALNNLNRDIATPEALPSTPNPPTKPAEPVKPEQPTTPVQPTPPTPTKPIQPIPGRVVYLTFDDGPSANTGRVLNILNQYGIKATFFVTCNGQNYNYYIKQAYDAGNAIGLHTCTHNYNIYRSADTYFADLNRVGDMVQGLIGIRPNIIRFPGGSSNTVSRRYARGIMGQLTAQVRAQGYQYFDWNCSSSDASGNNIPVATIISSSKCQPKQIVLLMHDTAAKNTTVQALPEIIEYYRARGYSFGVLTDSSYAAHHRVNN